MRRAPCSPPTFSRAFRYVRIYARTYARTHTHTLSLSLSRAGQRHTGLRRGASSQSEGAATRARSAPAHPSNHARSPRVLACRSPCRWAAARTQRRAAGRTSHTTCLDTPRAGRGCPAAPPIAIVQRVDGARRLRCGSLRCRPGHTAMLVARSRPRPVTSF